jgi:hypothetical protein
MELISILTALTVLGVLAIASSQRTASDVERTIREAIERGVLTDASLIPKLREPAGLTDFERLNLMGMMTLFASAGIVLVAFVLIVAVHGAPVPLFAIAIFAATLGAGLIACGRWLKRTRRQA